MNQAEIKQYIHNARTHAAKIEEYVNETYPDLCGWYSPLYLHVQKSGRIVIRDPRKNGREKTIRSFSGKDAPKQAADMLLRRFVDTIAYRIREAYGALSAKDVETLGLTEAAAEKAEARGDAQTMASLEKVL